MLRMPFGVMGMMFCSAMMVMLCGIEIERTK